MSSPDDGKLVVLAALELPTDDQGRFVITRKFIDGMDEYARQWRGPVVAAMQPAPHQGSNLDYEPVSNEELSFDVVPVHFEDHAAMRDLVRGASLVLSGPGYQQNYVSALCRELGVPCIYVTEYTLKTRIQVARAEEVNPLKRWRRIAWEWNQERENRKAIAHCAGLQANGTPTYESYRGLVDEALLFFDTRTAEDMLIDEDSLRARLEHLALGAPLRLAFSGRLVPMKGADALVAVARELEQRGMPFEMHICGDGSQADFIRQEARRLGLEQAVRLHGVLDFKTELIPMIKHEVDLFVCCHRQGDPSCTYLETMACGVPIVGFLNEAFEGLLELGDFGRGVPMDDVAALADLIVELDQARSRLAELSRNALTFARDHSFERTFARRIEQMRELSVTR